MLTKQTLEQLKAENLSDLYHQLGSSRETRDVLFILENLGYLPPDFDGDCLLPFLDHPSDQVRLWSVKNLGKLKDARYLAQLEPIAYGDPDSMVRREAVSSIGRMRSETAIPTLLHMLDDLDPKIVLQAIRGLLVFKDHAAVQDALLALENHPNEVIQEVITREFSGRSRRADPTHPKSPDFMKNVVVCGDVREVLTLVPDESIHLTFTSPPYYNARDYSIYASYQAYLDFLSDVFQAVHRVTKEGRFLIVNTSPVIIPRVSRAHSSTRYPIPFDLHARLAAMGWEFIDDIVWAKPEASVKNRNAGFLQHRKPLGYKPNPVTEYLMVYRKKTDKLLDWNMRQYDAETIEKSRILGSYETSNLWRIDPVFDKVHSAVFPIELCNRVIRFYSFIGDLVFDPFAGSGTFGKAAQNLERYFFLTEKDETYFQRITEDLSRPTLFRKVEPRFLNVIEFAGLSKEA